MNNRESAGCRGSQIALKRIHTLPAGSLPYRHVSGNPALGTGVSRAWICRGSRFLTSAPVTQAVTSGAGPNSLCCGANQNLTVFWMPSTRPTTTAPNSFQRSFPSIRNASSSSSRNILNMARPTSGGTASAKLHCVAKRPRSMPPQRGAPSVSPLFYRAATSCTTGPQTAIPAPEPAPRRQSSCGGQAGSGRGSAGVASSESHCT